MDDPTSDIRGPSIVYWAQNSKKPRASTSLSTAILAGTTTGTKLYGYKCLVLWSTKVLRKILSAHDTMKSKRIHKRENHEKTLFF